MPLRRAQDLLRLLSRRLPARQRVPRDRDAVLVHRLSGDAGRGVQELHGAAQAHAPDPGREAVLRGRRLSRESVVSSAVQCRCGRRVQLHVHATPFRLHELRPDATRGRGLLQIRV